MLNAIVLVICSVLAAVGALALFAYVGSLALSLSITLAIYALVLSCFATLGKAARRPAVRHH